jgi:hypothetical protein
MSIQHIRLQFFFTIDKNNNSSQFAKVLTLLPGHLATRFKLSCLGLTLRIVELTLFLVEKEVFTIYEIVVF